MRTPLSMLLFAGLLVVACGDSSSPTAPPQSGSAVRTPAPPIGSAAGAVITGTVLTGLARTSFPSAGASGLDTAAPGISVTIVGTSLTATADGSGQSVIRGVPPGNEELRFSGSGVDARISRSRTSGTSKRSASACA